MEKILNIINPEEERFLRKKVSPFDFNKYSKKEIEDLIRKMRKTMDEANGVGLAANQIGLDASLFVAKLDNKFYAIFNPELAKLSSEKNTLEEGCLSVGNRFSPVKRSESLVLKGFDRNNKPIKIKAWGVLARIFQHEVDHLNGKLFIDHK